MEVRLCRSVCRIGAVTPGIKRASGQPASRRREASTALNQHGRRKHPVAPADATSWFSCGRLGPHRPHTIPHAPQHMSAPPPDETATRPIWTCPIDQVHLGPTAEVPHAGICDSGTEPEKKLHPRK